MIKRTLFFIFFLSLVSCEPYEAQVRIVRSIHDVNKEKIKNLEKEIGNVLFFDIRAAVKSNKGVQRRSERVEAKIIGHQEHGGSIVRVFETKYEHGGKLVFYNIEGRELVIKSRAPNDLGDDYDGALDYLIAGRVDGRYVSVGDLRGPQSLEKNGFQLLSYTAPLLEN